MTVFAGGALPTCGNAGICAAQIATSPMSAPADPDNRSDPWHGEQFPRGTWTLQVDGAFLRARTNPRFEQFAGGRLGVGYYFLNRLSVNAEFPVYWVNQTGPNTAAGGFDLLARWHFVERGRLSLYLDGGAGLLVADRDVPRGGTHFNF